MSKFLPVLLKDVQSSAALELKDATTRRSLGSRLGFGLFGKFNKWSYTTGWDIERAVKDGYERVLWAYRAIDAIASNGARLPIRLLEGGEDAEDAKPIDDPLLRLLNRRSNAWESAFVFRYRLITQLLLSKKGVFVEVVYSKGGDPIRLHLLPPGDTNIVPDPQEFIKGFNVNIGEGEPDFVPAFDPATGKPKVIWIRKPHPTDPYMGTTPLEAAGLSIDMDYFARLYNRTFLINDGRPGGILGVKGELDDDDADTLRQRFAGGPSQAGKTTVIEADHLEWMDTAVSPRDAQFAQILKLTKEDLLAGFGTPLSILGDASGRTFDNADAEREVFWQETMPPYLDLIGGAFDAVTVGGLDDDTYLVHDTSSVEALQRAKYRRREQLLKELTEGTITINEFRDLIEKEGFDRVEARALYVPTSRTITVYAEGDAPDEQEPPEPPVPAVPALPAPDAVPALPAAPEAPVEAEPANDEAATVTAALVALTALSPEARGKVAAVLDVVIEDGGGGPFWKAPPKGQT